MWWVLAGHGEPKYDEDKIPHELYARYAKMGISERPSCARAARVGRNGSQRGG